jgi:hypothetical protein
MMMKNPALKFALFVGLAGILGCALAATKPAEQSNAVSSGEDSGITSSPGEDSQNDGEIDYENAKPIPMPSIPDTSNPEGKPGMSSPGTPQGRPGVSPGNSGTGRQNPQILIPPKKPSRNND